MNNRIKQFRLKSKLTQQQLADLMDVTRQAVTRWESGTVEPSTENLISLAQIFDCSVDELICNDLVTPKEKIIIKEVLVKEEKKPSFWSINKANIFLYIISVIAFITYLILRLTTNYSITVVAVVLFPIIIVSTLISLICNIDEIKDQHIPLLSKSSHICFVCKLRGNTGNVTDDDQTQKRYAFTFRGANLIGLDHIHRPGSTKAQNHNDFQNLGHKTNLSFLNKLFRISL